MLQLLQLSGTEFAEQGQRVVSALVPCQRVDAPPKVLRLRIPAPPQVIAQGLQFLKLLGQAVIDHDLAPLRLVRRKSRQLHLAGGHVFFEERRMAFPLLGGFTVGLVVVVGQLFP